MIRKPDRLAFGPAGVPRSSAGRSTEDGVRRVIEMGLDAMEIEFVRGVKMGEEAARRVREAAESGGVLLTVHAPYYVNLLSEDEDKVKASMNRIIESARVGSAAGAWSVVFHPGYYGKLDPKEAAGLARRRLTEVLRALKDEGVDIWVRPEVMGGLAELGDLEEVMAMVEGLDNALPCIDFAHLYARSLGSVNSKEAFRDVLSRVEGRLGREAIENMHIHVSGMEYGPRGERRHLPLEESEFRWRDLMDVLREFKPRGALICESPLLEDDAVLLRDYYRGVRRRGRGGKV